MKIEACLSYSIMVAMELPDGSSKEEILSAFYKEGERVSKATRIIPYVYACVCDSDSLKRELTNSYCKPIIERNL